MLLIGPNLPSVIQMQSQSEAEFPAAANEIRESGNHPASDQDTLRSRDVLISRMGGRSLGAVPC